MGPSIQTLENATLVLKKQDVGELMMNVRFPPSTASEWFSSKFPLQAKIYGCPFLELKSSETSMPLSINIDFFAAILGGDQRLGHRVIYIESEFSFYFYDPRDHIFKPTSEEKLQNLLRAYLIRCAEELPNSVHKLALFHEFRQDKHIRTIVHRAKSILAADSSFFAIGSPNQRNQGPESYEKLANYFVQQGFKREPGEILTLADAFNSYTHLLKHKDMDPIKRPFFKGMVIPIVKEEFKVSLRNDLLTSGNPKQLCGWKDLRMDMDTLAR